MLPGTAPGTPRRAREPAGARRGREHLRPRHRVPLDAGHLDRQGVRHGRGRHRRDRSASSIAAGIAYRVVHVHPSGHAGYYPGTAMMHLKVAVRPRPTGRVLGGQAAGFDGVDKRLDVLATAIRTGMTVFDLEELRTRLRSPVRLGEGPDQHGGLRREPTSCAATSSSGTPQDYPGGRRRRAHHRRAHARGVRHLAPARRRERAARNLRDGLRRLGHAQPAAAVLRRRLPLATSPTASLRQRGFTDVATLSGGSTTFRLVARHSTRPTTTRRARRWRTTPRRTSLFGRPDRRAGVHRPRLHRPRLPGPDHEARRERWTRPTPATRSGARVRPRLRARTLPRGRSGTATSWSRLEPEGPGYVAVIRKGGRQPCLRRGPRRRRPSTGRQDLVRRVLGRPRQGARLVHHRQRRAGHGRGGLDVLHLLGTQRPAARAPAEAREEGSWTGCSA